MPVLFSANTLVYDSLRFITDQLSSYLRHVFGMPLTDDWAIMSGHVSVNGSPLTNILNKVSVTLVNLEQESTLRNKLPARSSDALQLNPAISLNLEVLFAANFEHYDESLKFISSTLAFFQGHTVFRTPEQSGLPQGIERLVAELEATTYQQWSYLWGMLGTKYMPCAIYKIRMVTIQDKVVQGISPNAMGMNVSN